MNIILFEQFHSRKLYRGISKKELIDVCHNGTLIYRSFDGKVSLTDNIDIARKHSNYVVVVNCSNIENIGNGEYKAENPEDCEVSLIHEFDTKGNELGVYTLDEFLNEIN